MQRIFTGAQRHAVALHRLLKADGYDAIVMTGTDQPNASVFVPYSELEDQRAVERYIERMELERDAEGRAE